MEADCIVNRFAFWNTDGNNGNFCRQVFEHGLGKQACGNDALVDEQDHFFSVNVKPRTCFFAKPLKADCGCNRQELQKVSAVHGRKV